MASRLYSVDEVVASMQDLMAIPGPVEDDDGWSEDEFDGYIHDGDDKTANEGSELGERESGGGDSGAVVVTREREVTQGRERAVVVTWEQEVTQGRERAVVVTREREFPQGRERAVVVTRVKAC